MFAAPSPTQPSVLQFQRNFPQKPEQQQETQKVNNAANHQEALERNALHRSVLITLVLYGSHDKDRLNLPGSN